MSLLFSPHWASVFLVSQLSTAVPIQALETFWGQSGGTLKNNFSSLQAFFCPLFALLEAGEEQVALVVTPGMWCPHQSSCALELGRAVEQQLSPGDIPSLSPLSLQHPTLTKPTTHWLCAKSIFPWLLGPGTWLLLSPSPGTISGMVHLKLSLHQRVREGAGGRLWCKALSVWTLLSSKAASLPPRGGM